MRVLMITSEWPTPAHPEYVPFLVREVNELKKKAPQIDVFPFRGAMRPRNYVQSWMRVQRRLRGDHYDLVHAQFGQSGLLASLPKRQPLVVTFRGSDLNGIVGPNGQLTTVGRLLRKVSQWVAHRADEIILVSRQLARFLPEGRPFTVIPTGLDLRLFRPMSQADSRRALNLPLKRRYVLFAADRGNPIKRYALAREAVSNLPAGLDAELLVAEGVAPDKMPMYMNAADVLLLTSSREGSPNVVKEALACNVPVVSVDVGDVRQRLQGVSGCRVCDDDVQAIAAALCRVLDNGGRVDGREAVSHLDLRHTTEQIIDVYYKALATS